MNRLASLAALLLTLSILPFDVSGQYPVRIAGRILDAASRAPITDAIVTVAGSTVRPDLRGAFAISAAENALVHVRAPGYARAAVPVQTLRGASPDIAMKRFRPKALYLTVYGIGSTTLRSAALELIDTTELNALVIDLKGDRGLIPYPSGLRLAREIGAQQVITIRDLPQLVKDLRGRGIYTIGRIVLFKDNLLAEARPELAIRRRGGAVFRDGEGLAWTNPHNRNVWAYNIGIAVEAARAGFDEIQFDYARLPDATSLVYDLPWTEEGRSAAVEGFLVEARKALVPFNVFLAIDVFGYVCWNRDDTKIGQRLEPLANIVDYVSPMLYPSSFRHGIPGYRNPVEHPYEIVHLSLDQAGERTELPPLHFRPWLQAFRDYGFGGRPFTAGEVRRQIRAAEDAGTNGWMIWNPQNRYSAADFTADK